MRIRGELTFTSQVPSLQGSPKQFVLDKLGNDKSVSITCQGPSALKPGIQHSPASVNSTGEVAKEIQTKSKSKTALSENLYSQTDMQI